MTILSYKTIFGPTFSAILEYLLELFFRNVPKTAILAKIAMFGTLGRILGKIRIFLQKKALIFFNLIVPQLHAKFRKNSWSGFWDQLRDGRTDERTDAQG